MSVCVLRSRLLVFSFVLSAPAFAATNVLINGSFESGLTNWISATQLGGGAAGTCGYNGATAPGTETVTSTPGFPATDGTQIALGSVASTSGTGGDITCVLYQDVVIPPGATTATFSLDIGAKAGNDGAVLTAAVVGIYSSTSVPGLNAATLAGTRIIYAPAVADTVLTHQTSASFNVSTLVGQTVRFAILNAADFTGHEVIGLDNVQFLITLPAPPPIPTNFPAPTLSEWSMIGLTLLLGFVGFRVLQRRAT